MAPHSSTVARKILWMEEPGRLQSVGSLRVRHSLATEQQQPLLQKGSLLITIQCGLAILKLLSAHSRMGQISE